MEGKKSRLNNNTDLVVDRISDLPDAVLGHILSSLTNTDEAVATSILSKRWKFAWVTIHNLYFYNYMKEKEEEIMEFVRFVNRVLLLNVAGSLNKFSLACRPLYNSPFSPQIISWINTAITRNVHELYLSIGDMKWPTCVFSCESLRSLRLYGYTSIDEATVFCLPSLQSLRIDRVSIKSEEACERLLSGCPILHYLNLYIDDYGGDDDDDDFLFTCIISSASLRRLVICFERGSRLKLKASSLEHLDVHGCVREIFVEKSLSSLFQADICIDLDNDDLPNNSMVEAVRAFDCAKFLSLSAGVMQPLCRATIRLSTAFKRLVRLTAGTYCSSLQDFIQSSDNLEVLIINQGWPLTRDLHDHSRWTTPLEVPRCLSNSLKNVCFWGYNGLEDERVMICYILKYGSILEVMDISCRNKGDGEKLKLLKEISEFSRKSPVCKVQFI